MNKLDSEDISVLLHQSKTRQLDVIIINGSVCVQQHKKQNHKSYIILCELQTSFQDRKTIISTLNQESMSHD